MQNKYFTQETGLQVHDIFQVLRKISNKIPKTIISDDLEFDDQCAVQYNSQQKVLALLQPHRADNTGDRLHKLAEEFKG